MPSQTTRSPFVMAAAQTTPVAGDRATNLAQHLHMAQVAADRGVQLLLFPELSLSGYEPSRLWNCVTPANDPLLAPLKACARSHALTLVLGVPTAPENDQLKLPHISALVIGPDGQVQTYHKQHLHPGEEAFASAGPSRAFVFDVNGQTCGLAICADVSHASHPRSVRDAGATVYLAGMVISDNGYDADAALLRAHAIEHRMPVLMANMGAPSGGYRCAGRSAFWDADGRRIAALPGDGAGLLVMGLSGSGWNNHPVVL